MHCGNIFILIEIYHFNLILNCLNENDSFCLAILFKILAVVEYVLYALVLIQN